MEVITHGAADVDYLGPTWDEGLHPGQDCTANAKRVKTVK